MLAVAELAAAACHGKCCPYTLCDNCDTDARHPIHCIRLLCRKGCVSDIFLLACLCILKCSIVAAAAAAAAVAGLAAAVAGVKVQRLTCGLHVVILCYAVHQLLQRCYYRVGLQLLRWQVPLQPEHALGMIISTCALWHLQDWPVCSTAGDTGTWHVS